MKIEIRTVLQSVLYLVAMVGMQASVASDESMRQYQFSAGDDGYRLVMHEVPLPVMSPDQVLVRVHATSLNRRDVSLLNKAYGGRTNLVGTVPLSDGAGEVIAVGKNVTSVSVGDRVVGTFFSDWTGGERTRAAMSTARGGGTGGMLSEIIVTAPSGLTSIPEHLSYVEAATLPCAAVTAWVSLFERGGLQANDFVLLEGTGGVSSFGLLFATAAGANAIITSSSNDKLKRARKLGATGTVNYREQAQWQDIVRQLSNDAGVDHVLEIGGRDTLEKALQALAFDGHIALIGAVSGAAPPIPVGSLIRKSATASGIYVGSRADHERMNAFLSKHKIHPVVDRVFPFDEAPEAFDFMQNGSFMGKIVIKH